MATESIAAPPPVKTETRSIVHPLAPINPDEIQHAVSILKAEWPADTDFQFKAVTLSEPAKAEAVPYFEAEFHGDEVPHIDRRILVTYYIRQTVCMNTISCRSNVC